MTEQQYKDLLIATAKMSDYEHKDEVVEALKVASVSHHHNVKTMTEDRFKEYRF